jgi:UDP-3-O-acyl-N-acetylglucosamine deacetylase
MSEHPPPPLSTFTEPETESAETPPEFAAENEIAPARTFGFKRELDELVRRGLIKGASLENALLLDDNSVVNTNGFRVPQELAAHKLLDAVGDFALLGKPLLGTIELHQAGHSMHLRAVGEAIRQGVLKPAILKASGELFVDDNTNDELSEP